MINSTMIYKIHIIATWIHILSAVYWLGAILFTLTVLGPVMRFQPGKVATPIMSSIQNRVRRFVLVAIVLFVVTGSFNLYYRGLTDLGFFETSYGRIFLVKMIPVAVMFTIYFSAPLILRSLSPDSKGTCCELEEGPKRVGRVFAILHMIALACGIIVIFMGVMLRG